MTVDFEHRLKVRCNAQAAFDFIADPENNPRWQGGMQSCKWTSETQLVVGSTYAQHARFMGRDIKTEFVVTDYVPGQRISIESTVSTFPIQVTREVSADGEGGCVVRARVRGQPKGLMSLLSGMVKKSVKKDYAKLKVLLEKG